MSDILDVAYAVSHLQNRLQDRRQLIDHSSSVLGLRCCLEWSRYLHHKSHSESFDSSCHERTAGQSPGQLTGLNGNQTSTVAFGFTLQKAARINAVSKVLPHSHLEWLCRAIISQLSRAKL